MARDLPDLLRKGSGCLRTTYVDSYIYTCDICGKIPESKTQLEIHLDEDHDVDASEKDLDEMPYRIRKLQLYQMKLERLGVHLEHLSPVDLIEAPWWQVCSQVENLNENQQKLCMEIRESERSRYGESDRKRSQISDSEGLEDPIELEYHQLLAAVAHKSEEYQANLKINEEKEKELVFWRKKVSERKNCPDS